MEAVGDAYRYSVQEEQKGTGHAVACAREQFEGYDGDVLILYGDMPLVRRETYQAIIEKHRASGCRLHASNGGCGRSTRIRKNCARRGRKSKDNRRG